MKKFLTIVVGLFSMFSFIFMGSAISAEKVIKLDMSSFLPSTHKGSIVVEDWCKEVEKRTNGKVKINFHPGGTLTPGPQAYDSLVKGISDLASSSLAYTRGRFHMFELLDLPLGIKTGYMATKLSNDYYKHFKPKEFDDVKFLFFSSHGPGLIHSKMPIRNLEELQGKKIRCPGGTQVEVLKILGAIPVAMPMNDSYDALSKGIVDGMVGPSDVMFSYRLGEVVKYTTESFGASYVNTFFIAMNKEKWRSMPPDIQKIMETVSDEWASKGTAWDEADADGKNFMLKRGNKIISLSKEEDARWAARVKPLLDQYVKEKSAKGVPAAEGLKFCQEYLKKNQK